MLLVCISVDIVLCFLQEKATKWQNAGEVDGLTTNGVLMMQPGDHYGQTQKEAVWREVSVGGGIYALRESRSTPQKSAIVSTSVYQQQFGNA